MSLFSRTRWISEPEKIMKITDLEQSICEFKEVQLQGDYFIFKDSRKNLYAMPRSRFLTIQATEDAITLFFKNSDSKCTPPILVKYPDKNAQKHFERMFGGFAIFV